MHCRICGLAGEHPVFDAKEMTYGIGDLHPYFQCVGCGCLQIAQVPDDLGRYYGEAYYSFKPSRAKPVVGGLVALRNRYAVCRRGVLGQMLFKLQPTRLFDFLGPARQALTLDAGILDVGCGAGGLVRTFRQAGFRHARGVDPFVSADIALDGEPLVTRGSLPDVAGPLDLVMFHHSLEHMPDQLPTLQLAWQLLRPGGHCIVRVPLSSSLAWERYGVNWVQLDAPRHLYLHSVNSMLLLARQAGSDCLATTFDSTAFQFWGSEQYAQGITLHDARSHAMNAQASIFTAADIRRFEAEATTLNSARRGDQACFVLSRPAAA